MTRNLRKCQLDCHYLTSLEGPVLSPVNSLVSKYKYIKHINASQYFLHSLLVCVFGCSPTKRRMFLLGSGHRKLGWVTCSTPKTIMKKDRQAVLLDSTGETALIKAVHPVHHCMVAFTGI